MKYTCMTIAGVLAASFLTSCADYSSASVNARRGRAENMTTDAQLRQNRVQRANEREDAEHGRAMGGLQRAQVLDPLRDVREGVGLIRSF